ncbi:hypothetical protein LCGC14_1177420 [marine sediment metagenome]|uniref:MarR family transcriptional regulator n=1 Tax=marine sediment metagenome TaxID=412755 RepID=A0A0F9PTI5_9ZZZZ
MTGKRVEFTEAQWNLLRWIRDDLFADDANLHGAARPLYRKGLIGAMPVEGSDAAVEALFITDEGREALREHDGN